MAIPPISPITMPSLPSLPAIGGAGPATSFEGVLGNAVQTLASAQKNADTQAVRLATGQNVNLVDSVLAMQQTSLDFQLAMQVRDKVVDAYQTVMQTQL
ncbi:MAG: flagellar hook-basal body complex protein FliE [Candidatus Dormibacteraceae bacterium]